MQRMRTTLSLCVALLLAACLGAPEPQRPTRPPNSRPVTITAEPSRETRQCYADLSGADVRYSALPDRDFGGGCLLRGTVQLIDFGVPTTNLKAMTCPLARTFAAWVRYGVSPAAVEFMGSPVTKVETMGTYACRNIVGGGATTARLSEHATGNAVDVAAFILADGRRVSVKGDWTNRDTSVQGFLQAIHRSACRRFGTVLSPDYNAAHHDHLHLDMGRGPFCR